MNKNNIRNEINSFFSALPDDKLLQLSMETSKIITGQKEWKESEIILIFLTFGKEFQTGFLIKEALDSGKKVAVPRIYGKEMKFHYMETLEDTMELNRWDIREPLESTPFWKPEDGKTIMLTPGLAFTKNGERLGRGGGFYDRFLSEFGDCLFAAGLCFEEQIREKIPVSEHDYILDAVCSNQQYIRQV